MGWLGENNMNTLARTGVAQTAAGIGIEGIDAIAYSADGTQKNWDDTRRFFSDWGLKPLAEAVGAALDGLMMSPNPSPVGKYIHGQNVSMDWGSFSGTF